MTSLVKTILISLLVGVGLSYFKDYQLYVFESSTHNYSLKCMIMSSIYFFSSLFCYRYIINELKYKNTLHVYLISLLCICMLISAWFNAVFASPDIYFELIDVRAGDGLSWKNIYRSIEILSIIIASGNGINYLVDRLSCRNRRFGVIIKDNINLNNSK